MAAKAYATAALCVILTVSGAFAAAQTQPNQMAGVPQPAANAQPQQQPVDQQAQQTPAPSPPVGDPIPPLPRLPPVGQEAFNRVRQEVAPLSPTEIRELGRIVDDTERAASMPPRFVPRVVSSSVTATMLPGSTPPVVRLAASYVTSLVFMDAMGVPLKIRNVDLGSPKGFNLTWDDKAATGTNFLSISPRTLYPTGNIAVTLDNVPVPITLTLLSGQREVDDRVDVRVRGVVAGPVVGSAVASSGGVSANAQAMLGGVAPAGAKVLSASRNDVQAWYVGQRFYVRVPSGVTVLSPACVEYARGPDGSTVCTIPPIPVVALLVGRDTVNVMLSGY